jgi:hypothetical protein
MQRLEVSGAVRHIYIYIYIYIYVVRRQKVNGRFSGLGKCAQKEASVCDIVSI